MKIRSAFEPRDVVNGQIFSEPSLTQPDLSYSVRQLIEDGAVGQLPPLSRLSWAVVDDPEEDGRAVDTLEFDTYSDVRFSDRADAYEQLKASNNVIDAIKSKIKAMRDFHRKQASEFDPKSEV